MRHTITKEVPIEALLPWAKASQLFPVAGYLDSKKQEPHTAKEMADWAAIAWRKVKNEKICSSTAVSYSTAVSDSFGLLNCHGAYQCLFIEGKNGISNLVFKSKVSDRRFQEIHSKLLSLLGSWKPEPTNLTEFYIKCGSDWKLTPIHLATVREANEAWRDMPKDAIAYLVSLKEFNAGIFKKITGLSVKKKIKKS